MRYERLKHIDKEIMLERLHKRLNKRLFNGKLNDVVCHINSIKDGETLSECYAGYSNSGCIDFSEVLEQDILNLTQQQQLNVIATIMVHEMVHQYCYENGIDDSFHNEAFQRIAADHGLKCKKTEEGNLIDTDNRIIQLAVMTFRM